MAQLHRSVLRFPHHRLTALGIALSASLAVVSLARGDASTDAGTPALVSKLPLPNLPEVPHVALAEPTPESVERLKGITNRITSNDAAERTSATRELLEVDDELVPALRARINELAEKGDRTALKKLLASVRREARQNVRKQMKAEGKRGRVVTPDYLEMLTELARPDSKEWKQLTALIASSRMLRHIGTVEAVRELINVYVRFGEFVRVDTQLQLEKLGDKAVAALIETRRHEAAKIARWANRQLDALGEAIPSEAVQTGDQQVLADVLRAYGRIRDPDAARVVITFANSERAQIREAARQSIVMMGEVANWQLRDTYLNIVGKKPPRDWSWDRTARELLGEFDRLRLAQVYGHFERGLGDLEAGDLTKMGEAFDKVLARNPMFERRAEMVPGYVALARKVADEDRERAIDALRRAERLAGEDALGTEARSLRFTLEGEALLERGVADQLLFRRALELDAKNERARKVLDRIQRGEIEKETRLYRFIAAGAIGVIALLAMGFIALRRRTGSSEKLSNASSESIEEPEKKSDSDPAKTEEEDVAK